ncbi:MAG: outer membrane protein assembly factor [Bacteroidales bacterium]|nr:outer membrane protein assembly factor [Bacteroidales bacterium]
MTDIEGNRILFFKWVLAVLAALLAAGCNPTKYVPEGETLLNNNHVIINREDDIDRKNVIPYIKQQPNKRIFGSRFHLGLYNLSDINKEKWPHGWLREIGEEPAVFDPYAASKSREQIKSFLASKGFFDGVVEDSIRTEKRSSDLYYRINVKPAYTIRSLKYDIADTNLRKLCYIDSVNCLITRGKNYDVEVLQSELKRFERYIRNRGFYGFSGDYIHFMVDSTAGGRQVDITYSVRNFQEVDEAKAIREVSHSIYRIRNIYIFPDYVPRDAIEGGEKYLASLDTVNYNGYYFVTPNKRADIKYDVILQSMYFGPGDFYNVTNTEESQQHLLSMAVYRLVNINFRETDDDDPGDLTRMLDCNLQLTLLSRQSYRVELEGTNSAGNLGGAVNFIYSNRNLLRGGELFNMKLKAAYEAIAQDNRNIRSSQEYGAESSLKLPKFLLPFIQKESFIKKYNPTTNILAAYNYQDIPSYTRTMANATFGYNWQSGSYRQHIVNPLQFNVVDLLSIDSAYQAEIESSSYLAYSYEDVLILGGNYSFIFNNQSIQKSKDYWFLRFNGEATGNLLSAVNRLTGSASDTSYTLFGQQYAQYLRADIDVRYNYFINEAASVVYRGFFGIGIPYGNSKAIPFEKQYFSGGANGIRAWQVRSLGPGSYQPADTVFLNQTADIKLELNTEYRFKLFWILEGALFLDVGNIWSLREDPSRPGAKFGLTSFMKDLAVGTGTGLRFDLNFVLIRTDLGMKLRDPVATSGSNWIFLNRDYNFRDDFTFVIGIGYPF